MLEIFVSGGTPFKNQIKNRIQNLYESGRFIYTDNISSAQIVISEEDSAEIEKSGVVPYVYIEVMRNQSGDICAAQQVTGEQVDSFLLKDLSSVMQSSILMTELLMEKDFQLNKLAEKESEYLEEIGSIGRSINNAIEIQRSVMEESLKVPGYQAELVYIPKCFISGDFVLAKKVENKMFIFFGDVTEHGMYAAEYAASLISLAKGYLDGCSKWNANIEQFMAYMSRAAFYYHGKNSQSTCECVFCEIDESLNVAKWGTFSGGNISPIIARKDGAVEPVFGLFNAECIKPRLGDAFYEDSTSLHNLPGIVTTKFFAGDSVLFYTDGFSELFSGDKKDLLYAYGGENMTNAVKDACERNGNVPENIVEAVLNDLSSYGVGELSESSDIEDMIKDDATMYCIRREE